jgi:hypothetical protein
MREILRPLSAVRKYCLYCCGNQAKEVSLCPAENCMFHSFRFGRNPDSKNRLNLKLIRKKCLNCSCYSLKDVKNCWDNECPLFPYRMGKNPKLAGKRVQKYLFSKKSHHHGRVLDETAIDHS